MVISLKFLLLFLTSSQAAFRYSWNASTTSLKNTQKFTKFATDSTGKYLAALDHTAVKASIHLSTNYGLNWTLSAATNAHYSDITSNFDGKFLAATVVGGRISFSGDSGVTWILYENTPKAGWTSIDCDSKGINLVATTHNNGIYLSTDRGANWKLSTAPHVDIAWIGVTSDATGKHLVAVANTSEGVYYSKDSGATWTKSTLPGDSSKNKWSAVTSDRSGRYVAAVAGYSGKDTTIQGNHGVHYSSDYGQTFDRVYSTGQMHTIAMDQDTGSVLVTVIKDSCGNMYVMHSFDRGVKWNTSPTTKGAWSHVALNAAGDRMVAAQSKNGLLYTAIGEAFTPVEVPVKVRVKYNGTMHGSKVID